MKPSTPDPLNQLAIADRELAERIGSAWQDQAVPVAASEIARLADQILWGLSQEVSFGRAVAQGYSKLLAHGNLTAIQCYREQVQKAGQKGATLGLLMATHLAVVLLTGDRQLVQRFLSTIAILLDKGTYTLKKPLEALTAILKSGDLASAAAALKLFSLTFAQPMSYNQSLNLTYVLPKAILEFHPQRRTWQIAALTDVIAVDFRLAERFLEGMTRGLDLLAQTQLNLFVAQGLDRYRHNQPLGSKFLALESKLGMDTCQAMQITVPLTQVQPQLNRYLKARTGLTVAVRALSETAAVAGIIDDTPCVCSDGRYIYLSDEIRYFPDKAANRDLFKQMTRIEVGYYEFGTFAFDLDKALERIAACDPGDGFNGHAHPLDADESDPHADERLSDLDAFFRRFPIPGLASDLFTIYEHGRLRYHNMRRYPGLARQVYPIFKNELQRILKDGHGHRPLLLLYGQIALGLGAEDLPARDAKQLAPLAPLEALFHARMHPEAPVEVCAELVWRTYSRVERLMPAAAKTDANGAYSPLTLPFGRCLRPDWFYGTFQPYERLAAALQKRITAHGLKIYKSDIKQHLIDNQGRVSLEDLEVLLVQPHQDPSIDDPTDHRPTIDLSWLDLADDLGCEGLVGPEGKAPDEATFRYVEWDCHLADYLDDYVQVVQRPVFAAADDFYDLTLQRYHGLVKQIRRAFELLKPEGFKVLRQWLEGDDFDYRALIDYAVERKARRIPSERLYIKRVKAQRDVAALLLVDLSRSTANRAHGTRSRVIDIEKEAIVLLCEALAVVGDTYAIAGFSGTGRLCVDYYPIKNFDDPLDDQIRKRISAMAPHRSTRMGAAIRHATGILSNVPAKVRLLIVLGDGFPNDVDYKKKYAIEDTSKAIYEARAKRIHVKGITVNIVGDGRLDRVYGNFHHSVIADVRELPDKLLRIYGAITR